MPTNLTKKSNIYKNAGLASNFLGKNISKAEAQLAASKNILKGAEDALKNATRTKGIFRKRQVPLSANEINSNTSHLRSAVGDAEKTRQKAVKDTFNTRVGVGAVGATGVYGGKKLKERTSQNALTDSYGEYGRIPNDNYSGYNYTQASEYNTYIEKLATSALDYATGRYKIDRDKKGLNPITDIAMPTGITAGLVGVGKMGYNKYKGKPLVDFAGLKDIAKNPKASATTAGQAIKRQVAEQGTKFRGASVGGKAKMLGIGAGLLAASKLPSGAIDTVRGHNLAKANDTSFTPKNALQTTFVPFQAPEVIVKRKMNKVAVEIPGARGYLRKFLSEGIVHPAMIAVPMYAAPVGVSYALNKDIKSGFEPVRNRDATASNTSNAAKKKINSSLSDPRSNYNMAMSNEIMKSAGLKGIPKNPRMYSVKPMREVLEELPIAGARATMLAAPITYMMMHDPIQKHKQEERVVMEQKKEQDLIRKAVQAQKKEIKKQKRWF